MEILKHLNKEIDRAARNFAEAKETILEEIKSMTVNEAATYGAGYVSHIEKLTAAARELETLGRIYRMIEQK